MTVVTAVGPSEPVMVRICVVKYVEVEHERPLHPPRVVVRPVVLGETVVPQPVVTVEPALIGTELELGGGSSVRVSVSVSVVVSVAVVALTLVTTEVFVAVAVDVFVEVEVFVDVLVVVDVFVAVVVFTTVVVFADTLGVTGGHGGKSIPSRPPRSPPNRLSLCALMSLPFEVRSFAHSKVDS